MNNGADCLSVGKGGVMRSLVMAITSNAKRVAKIQRADGMERRAVIRKLVTGEAAVQKVKLSADEVVEAVLAVEREVFK